LIGSCSILYTDVVVELLMDHFRGTLGNEEGSVVFIKAQISSFIKIAFP